MDPRCEPPALLSVLLVEPHADGADSMAELLRLAGHRVTVARTGADALAATAADPHDVVLLEVRLPDLDGWQAARRLGEPGPDGRRPLMVAVTTCTSDADRRRLSEAGIDLHLVKPVDPVFLMGVLSRFVRVLVANFTGERAASGPDAIGAARAAGSWNDVIDSGPETRAAPASRSPSGVV